MTARIRWRPPLELLVVVRTPAGNRRAVGLRIAPDRPAAELLQRLAAHVGADGGALRLHAPGRRAPIDCAGDVAGLDLRIGEELWLLPDHRSPGTAPAGWWELAVLGGPLAGRRFPLVPGDRTLGRGADCDVRLDDASVSRTHLRLHVDAGSVTLSPAGPRAGTYLSARPIGPGHVAGRDDVLEVGHSLVAVRWATDAGAAAATASGRVPFNRPPSATVSPDPPRVRLPEAPVEPPRLRVPLAAVLAPVLLGLAVWVAAHSLLGLLFALGTPLMAVAPPLEDRVVGRLRRRRQARRFREQVAASCATLGVLRGREARARRALVPDAVELEARARLVLPALWERRPERPDFLRLRLGWADLPSGALVEVPGVGRPELREEAARAAAAGEVLPAVPLTLDVARTGAVGLAGPPAAVAALARWLLVQAAVLHSPHELRLAAFVPRPAAEWEWLRWLPHGRPAGDLATPPGSGAETAEWVAGDPDAQRRLALALQELVDGGDEAHGRDRRRQTGPAVLVLVHHEAPVERGRVARLLRDPVAGRAFVLWVASDPNQLPDGCREVVELDPAGMEVRLRGLGGGGETTGVPDLVDVAYAEGVARALARIEDVGAQDATAAPPGAVGLLECLRPLLTAEVDGDLPAALRRSWSRQAGDLSAPVGMGVDGVLCLDLREDGPHALVGGTSGSGKSEFLRTWVTALASLHSPRRLNVLLVDFKGGTAFRDCARLPHVVGVVTDLDQRLLGRVQQSLQAELKRREAELARFGEKEFADLQRRHPDAAFPVLLVVFDEFEQLLAEHPAFVSEVIVPVARLGRGLGVHLVLGTQKPQGSVPEAIRSNTNIRVALRMLSDAQSLDVIDAPDAARIPPWARGRAHLRLSHQRLVALQVAYAGRCGPDGVGADGPADFERLAAAMAEVVQADGVRLPRRPWLPPLPDVLPVPDLPAPRGEGAPIGLVDEPRRQAQWTLAHSPAADGHLLAWGAARSGKSTLLRTLACGLAASHSPSELWIYGLDFGSGALRPLEALPHVGGVATADDPERLAQLLRQLAGEVDVRRRALNARATGSWRDHGFPAILLLVDELAAFRAAFERVDGGRYTDLLDGLVRDGRGVGLSCALVTAHRRDLSGLLAASISRRLLLRPDRHDQEALEVVASLGPAPPPGRALVDGHLEMQVAVLADGADGGEGAAVAALAGLLAARGQVRTAPPVNVLPPDVAAGSLPQPSAALRAVLGLGGDAAEPLEVDLLRHGHLVVGGPRGSGRTTALATLAASASAIAGPPRLVLLAGRRHSELCTMGSWEQVALGAERCRELASALADELSRAGAARRPLMAVVDDAELLAEGPCDAALRGLARCGRDLPVRMVAAVEVRALRRYSEWLTELKESRHVVLLNPDVSADAEPFGVGQLPRPLHPWPPGRGFLLRAGRAVPIQVAVAHHRRRAAGAGL